QELNAVAIKACQRSVEDRYRSAREMREQLAAVERGQSVIRLEKRARLATRGMKAAVLAALLASAAVVSVWIKDTYRQAQEAARQQVLRQELMLQQLTVTRLTEHHSGWSGRCWDVAVGAAQVRMTPDVLNQAAGALSGLDAYSAHLRPGLKVESL